MSPKVLEENGQGSGFEMGWSGCLHPTNTVAMLVYSCCTVGSSALVAGDLAIYCFGQTHKDSSLFLWKLFGVGIFISCMKMEAV